MKLRLETVPVRVIETGKESGEAIAYQLTENLQQEDLNPIDQAKGILAFIQAKHPDLSASSGTQAGNVYNLDGVISELVNYSWAPKYVSESFSSTVEEILKILVKSITTTFYTLSLLKLVPKIQEPIIAGKRHFS
jgi:hypothetical protein